MEKDIIVTCPYNKSHRIRRYKLMTHIVKCKKQSNTTNKVSCPLNGIHIMEHSDMRDHLTSCSNLASLVRSSAEEKIDSAPIIKNDTYKSSENWDEAPETPSYDAMASSASKNVIRCVTGMTKSEKIKFKLSERDRIANLNETSTVERIPSLHREMIQEIPLRPPHGIAQALLSDTNVSQQISNKSAQKQDSVASAQLKSTTTNEFRDIFQRTLYNELLPNCEPDDNPMDITFSGNESQYVKSEDSAKMDSTLTQELLELSAANNNTSYKFFNSPGPSTRNWFEDTSRRGTNLSFTDENKEVEVRRESRGRGILRSKKKQKNIVTEVDASCQIFGANNSAIESDKHIENTHDMNTSNEKVTDKLLAILMDKTKKIELVDEKDESNLDSKFESILCKLNDRLDHLTNIQNAAVEQSARLVKEVNDLKQLKSCCNTQLPTVLNNPRCAANFSEPLSSTHSKNHNVSKEAPSFVKNMPNSSNASKDNDMFNLKNDSELHKLKTPQDFYHY